jgi:DNA-dependent protein kinase catalytic subunit
MIEVNGMDPETCLEATKPKDFTVFINMVDLAYDILPRVNPDCLLKWMDTLMETLIVQAIRQPLISGFNKLLTLCLNIYEKTGYYKVRLDVCLDVCLMLGEHFLT